MTLALATPIIEPPPTPMPSSAFGQREQQFNLSGVTWADYEAVLSMVGDRHIFVTYDRGRIEITSPSWAHDNRADRIGVMIRNVAEGLRVGVRGGGSATFRRADLDRGIEPDKCFYVANEPRVRNHTAIDPSVDPPPDLCVEVEMSSRLLDRIAIYAALGVPELWRDDGRWLRTFALAPDRAYVETPASLAFPTLSVGRLNRYLNWAAGWDETTWAGKVRRAARKRRPTP